MKRHGNLWNKIIDKENIKEGVINACKGSGKKTISKKKNITYTKGHIDETVDKISEIFANGFQTSKYYVYPLFDPKLRFIYCLPFFPDRIVHHCLVNVLAPIWDHLMYSGSYACRKGYGQHSAGTKCGVYAKRYKYCAQFDISQFYVNINHEGLEHLLRRKLKDEKVLETLDEIIDSIDTRKKNLEILYHMQNRGSICKDVSIEIDKLEYATSLEDSPAGLPIGNYTSQWFGNIYMNELDTFIKQTLRIKSEIRYCDDFLIFGNDKHVLHEQADMIEDFLWERLRLTLSKKEIYPTSQGIDFVGYRYFDNGLVLLRKRTAQKQKRLIAEIRKRMHDDDFDAERAESQLGSMNGLLKWAKTYHFRKSQNLDELVKEVKNIGKV